MCQGRVSLDQWPHLGIKGAVAEPWWQLDAEHFEDAADLLFKIDALGQLLIEKGIITEDGLVKPAKVKSLAKKWLSGVDLLLQGDAFK